MSVIDRPSALLPSSLALITALALAPLHTHANATESQPTESQLTEIKSLFNWAVYLSKYEQPAEIPELKFVDHEYLVLRACLGQPCDVIGWYNDKNIIYIDKTLASLDSMMERSVVVHEMVHYLQHKSGQFTAGCTDNTMREREAYEIQRQYFYAYGALSPIRMHELHCVPNPDTDPDTDPDTQTDKHSEMSDEQTEKHQTSSTE